MKKIRSKILLGWMLLLFIVSNSQAITAVFYDSEKQAIGINTYFDGWGGGIGIDFNNDHSSAGFIIQNIDGEMIPGEYDRFTTLGVYKSPSSHSTYYYYGSPVNLSELHVATNLIIDVKGAAKDGGDMIRYFVDEWNVAESQTIIYAQPINSTGSAVPVLASDLKNIYYQICSDYPNNPNAWQPIPEPATLLLLGLGAVMLRRKFKGCKNSVEHTADSGCRGWTVKR